MDKQRKKTILCISGSHESLLLYERIIVRDGVKNLLFIGAFDGKEGFQKATRIKPDLMIIDDVLPDVGNAHLEDGWLLSKKIQKELGPHILAVILLKSQRQIYGTPSDDWLKWLKNHLNDVVRKPIAPDVLVEKVNILLEAVDTTRAE